MWYAFQLNLENLGVQFAFRGGWFAVYGENEGSFGYNLRCFECKKWTPRIINEEKSVRSIGLKP